MDKFIVSGIAAIVIIFLTVMCVEVLVPLSKKQDFDTIARKSLMILEREGGLNSVNKSELTYDLMNIGMKSVSISAPLPGAAKYGQNVTLVVQGYYKVKFASSLFDFLKSTKIFRYTRTVTCRKVKNV